MLKGAFLLPHHMALAALSCGFSKGKASGGAPDFLSGGTPEAFSGPLPESPGHASHQVNRPDQANLADGSCVHSLGSAHENRASAIHYSSEQDRLSSLSGDVLNNEFLPPHASDTFANADDGSADSVSLTNARASFCAEEPLLGGQAVMEGVLMRNGASYAQAIRRSDGSIAVERRRWYSFIREDSYLKKPFIRGFSILVETLVNGVKALNRSAILSTLPEDGEEDLSDFQLTLMLMLALFLALALFIVVPHLMTLGITALGLSGDMKGLSFHIWDGLFKFTIFIGYIAAISFVPEIRRVFQYHGAEHKTIACFEHGSPMTVRAASGFSRLHPRCGTTFLLFVLSLAIILHALLVPLLLWLWEPQNSVLKHAGVLCFKIFLMIPISALAYELIRFAAKLGSGFLGTMLRAPGLLLQCLTTREPDDEQLEVAIAALYEALSESQRANAHFEIPAYTVLE